MQSMHPAYPPLPRPDTRPTAPPPQGDAPLPCVDSQALFGPARELHIDHQGQRYRLRITALGKLILTK